MVTALHRHKSSLEGLIDFCSQRPLSAHADERAQAVARFYRLVSHFEAVETNSTRATRGKPHYNRPTTALLSSALPFEYARPPESQDRFLAFFFRSLGVGMLDGGNLTFSDPGPW